MKTVLLRVTFCLLLLLPQDALGWNKKRRRRSIPEISESSLNTLIEAHPYTAVLFHDTSKISAKALYDLELIHDDSQKLGIQWGRVKSEPNVVTGFSPSDLNDYPCHLVLYRKGEPIMFGGKPDRQTIVFQWLITEMFCHLDAPLGLEMFQFEILIRSFRNFVVILEPHPLIHQFAEKSGICTDVGNVLVTSSADQGIYNYLTFESVQHSVINIIHGIPVPFEGDPSDLIMVEAWIRTTVKEGILSVGERELERILRRENEVMVLFMGDPKETKAIDPKLNSSISSFEVSYDLPTIRVKDLKISKSYGLKQLPQILLFQNGKPRRFEESTLDSPEAIHLLEEWIVDTLGRTEKTIIRSISSSVFKKSPDEFQNILLKEHKDSIRILSKEYARLQKENQELRSIIKAAQSALSSDIIDPPASANQKTGGVITAECRDCLSSVGQAVWTCGTLDVECIKTFVDVGSECYSCLCEVLDYWWPNDAPNCFKKEIQAITNASQSSGDSLDPSKHNEL